MTRSAVLVASRAKLRSCPVLTSPSLDMGKFYLEPLSRPNPKEKMGMCMGRDF